MKPALFMALAALCLSQPVEAGVVEERMFGDWPGWISTDAQTGDFDHCAMQDEYNSGIALTFGLYRTYDLAVTFANPDWRLQEGEIYRVRLRIDDRRPIEAQAEALSRYSVGVLFKEPDSLYRQLREGHVLRLETVATDLEFNLTGTHQALHELAYCVAEQLRAEEAVRDGTLSNPFVAARPDVSRETDVPEEMGAEKIDRGDLIAIVTNILLGAGIDDVSFIRQSDAPELFEDYQVVWSGSGRFGFADAVRHNGELSVDAVAAGIIANGSRYCDGQFVSGGQPAELTDNDIVNRQIFTACDSPEEPVRMDYTLIDDGEFIYNFATLTWIEDDEAAEPSISEALHRQALRQVAR